jgi:ribosomal protein S12 methylthiotransferase
VSTVGLISLGCPRNLVDSEVMLGLLKKKGFRISEDLSGCDAAIVNTCAFIEDAKRESIDLILQLIDLKKENKIKSIIVAGCLPQRYLAELKNDITEIDSFLGTGDFIKIADTVEKTLKGKRISAVSARPTFLPDHTYRRDLITPGHFIYLKIAEGCSNDCSYCVIPRIRGRLRSRAMDSLIKEVRIIKKGQPLSEINIIGQDITRYGTDLYGKPRLAELVRGLVKIRAAKWIRLLYTHPEHYTEDLIGVIKDEPTVCKYIDLPLQHINDNILKLMNRKITRKDILGLITRLRNEIPDLAIRTTFIVGFPGETDKEFNELVDFIRDMRFERLGVFEYSREEGTRADKFRGHIPDKIKRERFDSIMKLQQEIARDINSSFFGRELEVLIDETEEPNRPNGPNRLNRLNRLNGPNEPNRPNRPYNYIGRTQHDAPEVDGNIFVTSSKKHKPGDFITVKVVDTMEYDLVGYESTK